MDEQLERLRRAVARDPGDRVQAVRYAGALERAGRFEEAWELLDGLDAREELAALARRNPLRVLDRLHALDYRRARLMMERLAAIGEARHPAIAYLVNESPDQLLKTHARRTLIKGFPEMDQYLGLSEVQRVNFAAEGDRDSVARGRALRFIEQAGTANTVALLPWLLPFLALRDTELTTRALDVLRRLTHRDGPPFDADLLASLLREHQGEPA